ncbi:Ankyrin repeats (3 copies) [Pirellula sp. SH-Sr6A]|uniref:hypothetical protein n=1 Tax=Pirellula sp. SH-Sr6A TaxID=1632865 RepID=UPI00078EB096|nr:hypothetical protein [Pirellula sp. SH-Sr6A]AMV35206.1 Ankyrin repeats (3 copies) [Pirellula sp. SH-Sr6A]
MPRIDFTAPLIVTDTEDRRITDWSILSQFVGRSFENSDILRYFGQSIDEVPVAVLLDRSGDIQILANSRNNSLLAKSSLRSIRMLTAEELDALQNYVEGTWSDGVGECLELDDMSFYLDLDQVDRRQEDDGVVSLGSGTRNLFPAIHAGDIGKVRAAIDDGENVNAILGGTTTLGWAIAFADASIAHLLIDNGMDVHYLEHDMQTVLVSCAASRDFVDADASSVVVRLLTIGGFDHEINRTAEIAEQRGKVQLLKVLKQHQNA